MSEETEVFVFPSDPWWAAYVDNINASESYKEAASDWEGDITFVIEAEPDKNVPETVWGWMDLWHGECRAGSFVTPEEGLKAQLIIRASYTRWKQVIMKDLEPVKGMMQGKLKLQGDLPKILRYVNAATELVNIAGSVPTEFPDE